MGSRQEDEHHPAAVVRRDGVEPEQRCDENIRQLARRLRGGAFGTSVSQFLVEKKSWQRRRCRVTGKTLAALNFFAIRAGLFYLFNQTMKFLCSIHLDCCSLSKAWVASKT
jgi:hypothetical protein